MTTTTWPLLDGQSVAVNADAADLEKFMKAAQALEIMGLYEASRLLIEAQPPDPKGGRIDKVRHILGLEAEAALLFDMEASEALGPALGPEAAERLSSLTIDARRDFLFQLGRAMAAASHERREEVVT